MESSTEQFTIHNIAKIIQSKYHFRCHNLQHISFEIYDHNTLDFKVVSDEYVKEVIKNTMDEIFFHKQYTLATVHYVFKELATLAYI